MNKNAEVALGIKNFRREYTSNVHSLVKVQPIDPIIESLTSPNTFNTRFAQLGDAIRHCYNAAGDIAIRDKRYLETFLTGYTNPVISQSFKYEVARTYTDNNAYHPNGTPITFPEPRVMYSLTRTGQLSAVGVYTWVFKNGILLTDDKFTLYNTAYGVKCFIKATEIQDGDEVTVSINRHFNISGKHTKKFNISIPINNASYVIPVTDFGTFYHTRYLRVMVKRAGRYFTVPELNLLRDMDVTGNTVLVEIHNYPLLAGDVVYISNSVYTFYRELDYNRDATNPTTLPDFELKETKNGVVEPIPFMLAQDFDIFLNGYKLTPEVHYGVIDNCNTASEGHSVIRFFFNILPSINGDTQVKLRIFKNESSGYWDGCNFAYQTKLDTSGLLLRKWSSNQLPFMTRIGHGTSNGRYQINDNLSTKSHNILQLNPEVGLLKDFTFQSRTIYTYDIEEVINFAKRNLSEFDITTEILGEPEMFKRLKDNALTPTFPNLEDRTTEENCRISLFTNRANTHSKNFKTLLDRRLRPGVGMVLDTNKRSIAVSELALYHSTGMHLDCNAVCTDPLVINTNLAAP